MSLRISVVPILCAALALGGCDTSTSWTAPADAPFYNSALTGEYTLINAQSETVSNTDFAGQYQLIYFGYAYCPNVCPFDVQRMMRGYDQFAEANPDLADRVQPIFITVDPERDTPERVGQFAEAFSDDLIGLTGSNEQVEAAAASFFFTFQRTDPINEGGEYDINHPSIGYLVDPEGQPMAPIPVEHSPEAVATELEKWVS